MAEVERLVSGDTIVIADSLNYIKGYLLSYTGHVWLTETIFVVATENGDLYGFEGGQLKWSFPLLFGSNCSLSLSAMSQVIHNFFFQ